MVKHIIIWTLKDEYSDSEKKEIMAKCKSSLEALTGKIEGMLKIEVIIDTMPSSTNSAMMLNSEFEDEAALSRYLVDPGHIEAATFIRSVYATRNCIDYKI